MNLVLKIVGDKIESLEKDEFMSGTKNVYNLKMDFSGEEWNETPLKFCVFITDDKNIISPVLNNECVIPYEVLTKRDYIKIGVFGENETLDKRLTTNFLTVEVRNGSYISEATEPEIPTPDIWEQLVLKTIPYIGENGNWYIWDIATGDYVDSGNPATGGTNETEINNLIDEKIKSAILDSWGVAV